MWTPVRTYIEKFNPESWGNWRMWEKLVNCIKGNGGAQKTSCQVVQLADLMKQVPPNQLKMFQMFAKKHEEYKE